MPDGLNWVLDTEAAKTSEPSASTSGGKLNWVLDTEAERAPAQKPLNAAVAPPPPSVAAAPMPAPSAPMPPVDPRALSAVVGQEVQADVPGAPTFAAPAVPGSTPTPTPLPQADIDPTTGELIGGGTLGTGVGPSGAPPDLRPGFIESIPSGMGRATREGQRLAAGNAFVDQPPEAPVERTPMGRIGEAFGHSAPTTAGMFLGGAAGAAAGETTGLFGAVPGAAVGSALGMGVMAAAQALVPAYDQVRAQHPEMSHDEAVNQAITIAAANGSISAITAPLFALAPFKAAISNILFHSLVTAPVIGTAERAAIPALTGEPQPGLQQQAEGALSDVISGSMFAAGHAAVRHLTTPREGTLSFGVTGAEEPPPPAGQQQLAAPGAAPKPTEQESPDLPVPGQEREQFGPKEYFGPKEAFGPKEQEQFGPKEYFGPKEAAGPPAPEPFPTPEQDQPPAPAPTPADEPTDQSHPIVPAPSTGGVVPGSAAGGGQPLPGAGQGSTGQEPSTDTSQDQKQPTATDTTKTQEVSTAVPGVSLPTEYQVVEANSLKPATGDLQPRDRATRASSEAQIAENAARLDPNQVTTSPVADIGAPVVMPDGTVLAGNGRLATIQRAAELHPEKYQAYRAEIERLGHDTTGMTTPVLIRRTGDLTPEQARAFAEASNVTRAMTMSPVEQAKVDAKNLSDTALDKYDPAVPLTHGKNQGFIRDWMQSLPPTERNRLLDANGQLSQQGIQRLQGAVLAKAYNHDAILRRALESPNDDVKSVTNSLMDVAAPWSKMKAEVTADRIPGAFDITKNLTEALDLITQARAKGIAPGDMLKQGDVFAGQVDPITEQIIRTFYNDKLDRLRSRKGISEALSDYVDQALTFKPGKDLFGNETQPDPANALKEAREGKQGGLLDKAKVDAARDVLRDRAASIRMRETDESLARRGVTREEADREAAGGEPETDTITARLPQLQSELDQRNKQLAPLQASVDALRAKGATIKPAEARKLKAQEKQLAALTATRDKLLKRMPGRASRAATGKKPMPRVISPFRPKRPQDPANYADYQFRDGSSVWRQAFTDAGHDPDLATSKPIKWQVDTLSKQFEAKFGVPVTLAPDMDLLQARSVILDVYRATHDMMPALGYQHAFFGLPEISATGQVTNFLKGLILEPYHPKVDYAGAFSPGPNTIHLTGTANSLGHEWLHALDHWLAYKLPYIVPPAAFKRPLASEMITQGAAVSPVTDPVQAALIHVMQTLFYDDAHLVAQRFRWETEAQEVDRFGNPTPKAQDAQAELDKLTIGEESGAIDMSRFRALSQTFGGGAKDDYYSTAYEMITRAHEAVMAREMEAMGVDPVGVFMPTAAYADQLIRRLRMTYPPQDDYAAILQAFSVLHSEIQNQYKYGDNGKLFSDQGDKLDRGAMDRLQQIVEPGLWKFIRRGLQEAGQGLAHPVEAWRETAFTDGSRPDPGHFKLVQRIAHYMRTTLGIKVGALEVMHAHGVNQGLAREATEALQAIIDKLAMKPGSGRGSPQPTFEERSQELGKGWVMRMSNILANKNLAGKQLRGKNYSNNDALRHALTTGEDEYQGKPLSENMKKAVGQLRELMDEVFKSLSDAGLKIGYSKSGHFPRQYDTKRIWRDSQGFILDATELHKLIFDQEVGPSGDDPQALLDRWRTLSDDDRRNIGTQETIDGMDALAANLREQRAIERDLNDPNFTGDKAKRQDQLDALKDAARELAEKHHPAVRDDLSKNAATEWEGRIAKGYPNDFDTVGPNASFMKARVLPPETDQIMEKWLMRDVQSVLAGYMLSAGRKQAYVETFGHPSAASVGGRELERLIHLMHQQGKDGGFKGEDIGVVRDVVEAVAGRTSSRRLRNFAKFANVVQAYGVVRLLGRSALSMLSEPYVSALATQDVRVGLKAFAAQFGNLMHTSDAVQRAELMDFIGVTTGVMYDDAMQARNGTEYADSMGFHRMMPALYRMSGMTALNNANRRASGAAMHWYLGKISNDWLRFRNYQGPQKGIHYNTLHTKWDKADRMMNEIGIPQDDETREAFASWMIAHDGLPTMEEMLNSNWKTTYALAMRRLVNRGVQNPSKAEQPMMAEDPVLRLMLQFQSFNYSMDRNVIGPAIHSIPEATGRAYQRARGQGYGKTASAGFGAASGAWATAHLAMLAGTFLMITMLTAIPRIWLFSRDLWDRLHDEDRFGEFLRDYALSASGLQGKFTLPLATVNQLRFKTSLSEITDGPGMASMMQDLQNVITPMFGAGEPSSTNTRLHNQAASAYNMTILPMLAFVLSRIGAALGPLGVFGSGAINAFTSSRRAGETVADWLTSEKGTTPAPPEDAEIKMPEMPKMPGEEDTAAAKADAKAAERDSGSGAMMTALGILDDIVPAYSRTLIAALTSLPGPIKYLGSAGLAGWGAYSYWTDTEKYREGTPPKKE
jgi:hypothetical protein